MHILLKTTSISSQIFIIYMGASINLHATPKKWRNFCFVLFFFNGEMLSLGDMMWFS